MSSIDNPRPVPTAQVAPFVEALGFDDAVTFLLQFGGAEMSFAQSPKGRSEVEALLGAEAVSRLANHCGITQRRIPLAKPWLARVLFWRGYSKAGIARQLKASDVSVRSWLKGAAS